jgi:hypothetical protein
MDPRPDRCLFLCFCCACTRSRGKRSVFRCMRKTVIIRKVYGMCNSTSRGGTYRICMPRAFHGEFYARKCIEKRSGGRTPCVAPLLRFIVLCTSIRHRYYCYYYVCYYCVLRLRFDRGKPPLTLHVSFC